MMCIRLYNNVFSDTDNVVLQFRVTKSGTAIQLQIMMMQVKV